MATEWWRERWISVAFQPPFIHSAIINKWDIWEWKNEKNESFSLITWSRRFDIRWDKLFPTLLNRPYKLVFGTSPTQWFKNFDLSYHFWWRPEVTVNPLNPNFRLISKIYHPWKFGDSISCSFWEKGWTRKTGNRLFFKPEVTDQKSGSRFSIPDQYLPSLKISWKSVHAFGKNRVRKKHVMTRKLKIVKILTTSCVDRKSRTYT